MTRNECLRKLAHLAAFWPALLLPWLSPIQALFIALGLVFMNMFLLPRLAKSLYRSHEPGKGELEIILYPCAVAACIIAFGFAGSTGKPAWYLPVMAAWFGLAGVDAFIGIACRLFPKGPTFPWNARKPILAVILGGVFACLVAEILIHVLVSTHITPGDGTWDAYLNPAGRLTGNLPWLYALIAIAALAETAWFGIADNLVIPFSLCILLPFIPSPLFETAHSTAIIESVTRIFSQGSFISQNNYFSENGFSFVTQSILPLLSALAFGIAAYAAGLLTLGGAFLGGLLSLVLVLANPWLFAFLVGFFLLGNGATRFGLKLKLSRGIAEARAGKRGAAEVFGAMGVAAWMTPLVHLTSSDSLGFAPKALLVCIAPIIAKTMDTVSSEIGKTLAGKTWSLKTFQWVAPGTQGGISLGGTLWGLAAAAGITLPVLILKWGNGLDCLVLIGIGILANLFEAFWLGWAGPRKMNQGSYANVLMTLVAAILAWMWWFGPL